MQGHWRLFQHVASRSKAQSVRDLPVLRPLWGHFALLLPQRAAFHQLLVDCRSRMSLHSRPAAVRAHPFK